MDAHVSCRGERVGIVVRAHTQKSDERTECVQSVAESRADRKGVTGAEQSHGIKERDVEQSLKIHTL